MDQVRDKKVHLLRTFFFGQKRCNRYTPFCTSILQKGDLTMSTLFERLGGAPAVDAAVDIFYRKVLTDDRISHFFEDVDMDRQAAKQKAFLTMVMGDRPTIPASTCAPAT